MSIRNAILKAADHIEANPASYNFFKSDSPSTIDGTSCLIGWACFFAGRPGHVLRHESPLGFGFVDLGDFARNHDDWMRRDLWNYQQHAVAGADLLRLYADARYPAAPVLLPNWNAIACSAERVKESAISEEVR